MAYCPRCGTANPAGVPKCPLCATSLPQFTDETPLPSPWPSPLQDQTAKIMATPPERRRWTLWILTSLLLFPAVLVTGIDVLLTGRVTWSWIPDMALVGLWALVLGTVKWYRQPLVLVPFGALLAAVVVVLANLFSRGVLDWSLWAGLPVVGWTYSLVWALALWLRLSPNPGWNLFGHLCWGTAALCAGIELILRSAGLNGPGLAWSAIVALVLLPLGLFFEVLHYGLGRRLNLRQSFHF